MPALASSRVVAPVVAVALAFVAPAAFGATLEVGPGKPYALPCEAFAATNDGDLVNIDAAGSYVGDVCQVSTNNLTIRGVGGARPTIDAGGQNAQGKGTWVISGNDVIVENVAFIGASVPDQNGAGIRFEGSGLQVRGCLFRDNENGILSGGGGPILIESSEFDHNGLGGGCNGGGCAHNLYIGEAERLTFRFNYTHGVVESHTLKSRALENVVEYNLVSTADGSGSYELEFPNGGKTRVVGNVIIQGAGTGNPSIVGYGFEGVTGAHADTLFVVNNTFVNQLDSGTFVATGGDVATPAVLRNNIFVGGGTHASQASAIEEGSCNDDPQFFDPGGFDYRIEVGSPCADVGVEPGSDGTTDLRPLSHYIHPLLAEERVQVGTIDAGAYELGVSGPSSTGVTTAATGGTTGPGGTGPGGSSATGGSTSGGNGGSGTDGGDADDGCSCNVDGASSGRLAPMLAVLAAAFGVARLRRRR